jgi:CheY-like chemotaxis protein
LRIVAERCPDGVLLDLNLSETDGLAVATTRAAACSRARIVLTSAIVAHLPAELVQSSAATAFVSKDALASVDLAALFTFQA